MRLVRCAVVAVACALVLLLPAAPRATGAEPVIVALGDSLTAGFGVPPDAAYPARLAARLERQGYRYRVVNAGVSGDTSAGALRRVDWVLRTRPAIVIVAVGANDGLRGQSVTALARNLEEIVERCQAAGARVLLAGMRLPPNYGEEYARAFTGVFPAVARRTNAALMPFLLDGVAAIPELNLADGIHPNAAGHAAIADRLWAHLRPLLGAPGGAR